jgi:hypothetical protein
MGGLRFGETLRLLVDTPQIVEHRCQIGSIGGRILSGQLALDVGGLLIGVRGERLRTTRR